MSPSLSYRNRIVLLLTALIFIFACSIDTGTTTSQPAFDATKASLEFQATAMVLQLTQSAMNNQPPAAAPTVAPPISPPTVSVANTAPPAMAEGFDTWMKSAKILLYEDMAADFNVRRYVNQALRNMGLNYIDVKDAVGHYKNQLLSSTDWDLIISAKEWRGDVQGEFYVYINDSISRGSSVIIEEWAMDQIGNGRLNAITGRCGVEFSRNWMGRPIEDHLLAAINRDHPIHHIPNDGVALTNPTGYWLGMDLGDRMRLSPGGDAVALWGLYDLDSPSQSDDLTAVTCLDGRLIIQTYGTHSYGESRVIRVWENYIYNTLKARYDYLAAK